MLTIQNIFSDSISYAQFRLAALSVNIPEPYRFVEDQVFIPACVLGLTCLVNTALIMSWDGVNKQALTHTTTLVFITGGLFSVLTYFIQPCF